jgi:trk system potassium uptake protein TrkA
LADVDMLIAASGSDETNLIACMMAARLGVPRKIARVRDPDFYENRSAAFTMEDFGVDLFIRPEREVADEVIRLLTRSFASELIDFEGGRILLLGLHLEENYIGIGKPLRDLGSAAERADFRIVAIHREGRTIIPGGDDVLQKGDQVFLVTRQERLTRALALLGKDNERIRKVMLLGGTGVALEVARRLEEHDFTPILVDNNHERAVAAAAILGKTLVVEAQGFEIDTLVQEGLPTMDAFVALSGDEENNIILSLLARHLGVRKTIAMVTRTPYMSFLPSIGINSTVNIRQSTANAILRFIRKGEVISVSTLQGIDAEVIELRIPETSRVIKRQLKDLDLPDGSLVAAVIRDREAFVPNGESRLQGNDRVILFALPKAINKIETAFE